MRFVSLCLVLVLSASTGLAQPPQSGQRFPGGQPGGPPQGAQPGGFPGGQRGGPPQGFPGPGGPPADPIVALFDTNNDGELSAEEMSRAPQVLKRLDRNRDGQLTLDEFPRPSFGGGRGGFGGGPGLGGDSGPRTRSVVEQFDSDKNGRLDKAERAKAREFLAANPRQSGPGRRGPGGRRGRGGPGGGSSASPGRPGPEVSPDGVKIYPDKDLYDESIIRTVFLTFPESDWEKELAAFYRTDVDVPATMVVDGVTYEDAGVAFRGNSSFFTVAEGSKRSFNIRTDHAAKRDLYGYRTLNFLNSHTDPSFLRTVLYNHVARNYIPAAKSNFVRVVVNGRSWGLYINEQQQNKDFLDDWFDTKKGLRWKVPAGGGGGASAMTYNGEDEDAYRGYVLKSKETESARTDLIAVTKALAETPVEKLDTELDKVLNVDRALWFLAIDNVLIDRDGYYSRGMDYLVFQDSKFGRFHVLPYDSNETFRTAGSGGGPPGGFGGPGGNQGGPEPDGPFGLSPFSGESQERLALLNRLLANPRLRARYVAHVRTLTEEWLTWDRIGPVIERLHNLIEPEIKADTRMLYGYDAFADSLDSDQTGRSAPGFRPFVEKRGAYLRGLPELKAPAPTIANVRESIADRRMTIAARITGPKLSAAVLHYRTTKYGRFTQVPMKVSAAGQYAAQLPPLPPGEKGSYYIEARADDDARTTRFEPTNTEIGARKFRIPKEPKTD